MNEAFKRRLKEESAREGMTRARRFTSDRALGKVSRLTLTIRGKAYTFDIRRELDLTSRDSADILGDHAMRFAFWKRMLVESSRERRETEIKLEELKESAYLQYRAHLMKEGESRPTEHHIMAEVRTYPAVVDLSVQLKDALYREETCRMMTDAFEHRRTVMMKMWRVSD